MAFSLTAAQKAELQTLRNSFPAVDAAGYSQSLNYYTMYEKVSLYIASYEAAGNSLTSDEAITKIWLQGVREVNADVGPQSTFIRNYNSIQSEIRFGTPISKADLDKASDKIALLVIDTILSSVTFPNIVALAGHDVATVSNDLLNNDTGAWAGNPLLLALGYSDPFYNNILEKPGDTYDLLSVYKAMKATGFSGDFSNIDLADLFFNTLGIVKTSGAVATVLAADISTGLFLNEAYGFVGKAPSLTVTNVILLGRGDDNADKLVATADAEYIHGGGGNDTIDGSLTGGYDKDVVDGGAGKDTLDFSHITVKTEVDSTTQGHAKFSLEIDKADIGSLFSTTYAYNIENLKLGSGDDKINIRLDKNASLEKLDTGAGDDKVIIRLADQDHVFKELATGAGDDVVDISGAAKGSTPTIYLGAGNDILKGATEGAIIYGDAGADTFYIGKNYLIADADASDQISYNGKILTGGIRWNNALTGAAFAATQNATAR